MPNIDPGAKTWELGLARRIGEAVKARRIALKLTAVELAERTKELGYPITRVAITKIEGNNRAGKFDVAELLVIAAALNTSPALLLYPGPYNEDVELLPDEVYAEFDAVQWFSGSGYWKTIQGDDTDARAAGRSWAASARSLQTWRALAAADQQRMWLASRADDRDRQQIAFLDDQIRRLREELGLADNA